MKKILFTSIFMLSFVFGFSQPGTAVQSISDLYLEPTSFKNNIRIYTYYVDPTQAVSCDTVEWGWSAGNNIILTTNTTFINMGPEDAIFDNQNPLCDSGQMVYHSCHGHSHIAGFQQFYVKDKCGNIVKQSNKVGFNMGSNFPWPYAYRYNYLTGLYQYQKVTTQAEWDNILLTGCQVDSLRANNNFNPYANADDYQVVDVYYGDSYGWSYRGQGVRINGIVDGYYTFGCILDPPHCAINEGDNCWPNVVEVPVLIQGTNVTVVNNLQYSNPEPVYNLDANVNGSNVLVTWGASGEYCSFDVIPVYVQGNTERRLTNRTISVNTNSANFSTTQLYQDARALGQGNGPAKYKFVVVTKNGTLMSLESKTRQSVNVR